MEVVSKYFYAAYGKYITRFRALPLDIDMLRPVERRILLAVHDVAKGYAKSAKVVGHCLGNYHPHGDASVYQTLVKYVNMGLVDGQGGFYTHGIQKNPPAAMRYTEVKENEIIAKLMQLTPYAPHDVLEFANEPIYIPSPIPIGLIGNKISYGVSFHKTVYPTFKVLALFNKLLSLLEGKNKLLSPYLAGCKYVGSRHELSKLYKHGKCRLEFLPEYREEKDGLHLFGEPLSWNTVLRCLEKNKQSYMDLSAENTHVIIHKKCEDSLKQAVNCEVIVVNTAGEPRTAGIDSIILNAFEHYKLALETKLRDDINRKENILRDYKIIKEIKPYVSKYSNLDRILKKVKEKNVDQVLKKYSITKLVNIESDITKITKELDKLKTNVKNIDTFSIDQVNFLREDLKNVKEI